MSPSPDGAAKALRTAQIVLEVLAFLVVGGGAVVSFLIYREMGKAYILLFGAFLTLGAIALLVLIIATLRSYR